MLILSHSYDTIVYRKRNKAPCRFDVNRGIIMKRAIAVVLAVLMLAAVLCACAAEELKMDFKYVGTYSFTQSTLAETATRTITLNSDSTYNYVHESDIDGRTGEFSGTWGVNSEGLIILTAKSGEISKATPRSDGKSLNIADIGRVTDTVGDGIYFLVEDSAD